MNYLYKINYFQKNNTQPYVEPPPTYYEPPTQQPEYRVPQYIRRNWNKYRNKHRNRNDDEED